MQGKTEKYLDGFMWWGKKFDDAKNEGRSDKVDGRFRVSYLVQVFFTRHAFDAVDPMVRIC